MIIARTSFGELSETARGVGNHIKTGEQQVLLVSIEGNEAPTVLKGKCKPQPAKDGSVFINPQNLEPVQDAETLQKIIKATTMDPSREQPVVLTSINDL